MTKSPNPNPFGDLLTREFVGGVIRKLTRSTGTPVFDDDLIQEALLRSLIAQRRSQTIRHPAPFLPRLFGIP